MTTIRDQEKEIQLLTTACTMSGYNTNGYMRHVIVRMHQGEIEHGEDTFMNKEVWKELMDEAADIAGWSLLEQHKLDEYRRAGCDTGKIIYLEQILMENMKEAARMHTNMAHATSMAEELEAEYERKRGR